MNYEIVDTLYRSRITLLDHLNTSGYDVSKFLQYAADGTPYAKFSPKEIGEMVKASASIKGGAPALEMTLTRKEPSETEPNTCLVVYCLDRIKQKILSVTKKIMKMDEEDEEPLDAKDTDLIVVTLEPIAPNFHLVAYQMHKEGVRVRYFQAATLINNPLKHVLVPKHEKVPKDQEESLLTSLYAKKKNLPLIKFHEDPIARMIGLLPEDIVKITRPSPTAGECVVYRLCSP